VSRRSDQRRAAVFALYQHELTGRALDEVFERDAASFTRALAHATSDHADELDGHISAHAEGWTLDRIAPLERSILRVALHEMQSREDVPVEVAIDEAIEAAKELCSAEAPKFVNGILGAVQRERVGAG
jgi:transcription antitermination protein NusB